MKRYLIRKGKKYINKCNVIIFMVTAENHTENPPSFHEVTLKPQPLHLSLSKLLYINPHRPPRTTLASTSIRSSLTRRKKKSHQSFRAALAHSQTLSTEGKKIRQWKQRSVATTSALPRPLLIPRTSVLPRTNATLLLQQ